MQFSVEEEGGVGVFHLVDTLYLVGIFQQH